MECLQKAAQFDFEEIGNGGIFATREKVHKSEAISNKPLRLRNYFPGLLFCINTLCDSGFFRLGAYGFKAQSSRA